MGLPNKQTGWSVESNLLHDILKAIKRLGSNISNKLDKVSTITSEAQVYGKTPSGDQIMYNLSDISGIKSIDNLELLGDGTLKLSFTDNTNTPQTVETSLESLISIKYNVANYTALLAVSGQALYDFAYVRSSQGTPWLPGSLGGTYYGAGLYMWNGSAWVEDKTDIYQGINNIILTKIDTLTSPNNSITILGSGASRTIEITQALITNNSVTGAYNIDWTKDTWDLILTGNTTLSDTNLPASGTTKTISLYVTGNFTLTYPSGWTTSIIGAYDGVVLNQIIVEYRSTGNYFVVINQPD